MTKKTKREPTKAELKKKLWRVFSKYVRIRDKGQCISCNKVVERYQDYDCGHFVPAGSCGIYLYFDERNNNGQCTTCNRWKKGNGSAYSLRLIQKYGEGIIEELWAIKRDTLGARWPRYIYEEKIELYTDLLEELKNE